MEYDWRSIRYICYTIDPDDENHKWHSLDFDLGDMGIYGYPLNASELGKCTCTHKMSSNRVDIFQQIATMAEALIKEISKQFLDIFFHCILSTLCLVIFKNL